MSMWTSFSARAHLHLYTQGVCVSFLRVIKSNTHRKKCCIHTFGGLIGTCVSYDIVPIKCQQQLHYGSVVCHWIALWFDRKFRNYANIIVPQTVIQMMNWVVSMKMKINPRLSIKWDEHRLILQARDRLIHRTHTLDRSMSACQRCPFSMPNMVFVLCERHELTRARPSFATIAHIFFPLVVCVSILFSVRCLYFRFISIVVFVFFLFSICIY